MIAEVSDRLPESGELASVLAALMGLERDDLEVQARRPIATSSTFPSEVVDVRRPDGSVLPVYCKYSGGRDYPSHGHRGGVAYEAHVYRQVLALARMTTPQFIGAHGGRDGDEAWLFLEYLEGADRVSKSRDGPARAGAWIGAFQRRLESWAATAPEAHTVTRYDAAYYRGWIERTCEFVDPGRRARWLRDLAAQADVISGLIAGLTPTVIHGEYTPANILYRTGVVHVVDWESAAIGAGEIDLAFLTDAWDHDAAAEMERAYYEARYPDGRPERASEALQLARLYIQARWLGDRMLWRRHGSMPWEVARLEDVARGLGFV